MTSTLSPSAIYRLIFLVENDDRPTSKQKKKRSRITLPGLSYAKHNLQQVNSKWKAVHKLYMGIKPAPPLDSLRSLKLALVLRGKVDGADVSAIFAHGQPLEFWGCPRLLVSNIVEAFTALQNEPDFLDMTVIALSDIGATMPSEAWSEVYTIHLPCYACTTVKTVDERSIPRLNYPEFEGPVGAVDFLVEKFHVSSKSFRKWLNLELHYKLKRGTTETEREQSSFIHKIRIRLSGATCPAQGLSRTANRSSATLLLLPDFASEVFGFLERAHVGSSLPVHHLKCAFEQEVFGRGFIPYASGAYWLEIRHVQRELSYTDLRRFKVPSITGAEHDCALIRHYLSNSHVADLLDPEADFPFAIKMFASLATRNFSIGRVELCADAQRLSDYRSMDAIFGGIRMSTLELSCDEHRFVELVKTTDFFRMSTIQGLRELKLTLRRARNGEEKPGWYAGSVSPLWVGGIYLLRNCDCYQVDYGTDRHLRSIERRIVRICEDFERGTITDIVKNFQFRSMKKMNYAFSRDNLVVSGMKVEGNGDWVQITNFKWDVYRFRNASTNEYLTACVGRNASAFGSKSVLQISKGEVYPDASLAELSYAIYW